MLGFARALFRPRDIERLGVSDWVEMFSFNGNTYPINFGATNANSTTEEIENDFEGYVSRCYKANGVVFAVVNARARIFAQMRFQFQRANKGRYGDLYSTPQLSLLEEPWPNGPTSEALWRAIQDADLAGNSYMVKEFVKETRKFRMRRLRPDWVDILLTAPPDKALQSDVKAYIYKPGGTSDPALWEVFPIDGSNGVVAHWSPIPDPVAQYRGMSWLTPIITDILADTAMDKHKYKFFTHGAQPGIAVSLKETVTPEQFDDFMDKIDKHHNGVDNAYRTLYLGGGADVHVIGTNLQQMDFKVTQGHGETRIASAGGIHPVLLGLAENMHGPQPLDARILTPGGWSTMGTMAVGTEVIGIDGLPHRVIGVYPQGEQDVYRVRMADGTSAESTIDHVWRVVTNYGVERDLTLREIVDSGVRGGAGQVKWHIANADPIEYGEVGQLPLDPYLLGVLLGDGSFRGSSVRCASHGDDVDELLDAFRAALPANVSVSARKNRNDTGWSFGFPRVPGTEQANALKQAIRQLGLDGLLSSDKFVPEVYLRAAPKDRLALLQGLIDSDGSIDGSVASFSTTSRALADAVAELAMSLGGNASIAAIPRRRGHHLDQWRVRVRQLPDWAIPCRLSRKVAAYEPSGRGDRSRAIDSVVFSRRAQAQCILVDYDAHMYITDDFIPTHNTPLNTGNFQAAKDMAYEVFLSEAWASLCGAWGKLVDVPQDGSRLWYDMRDVPFLRQNRQELAEIQREQMATMSSGIQAGFTPDSVVKATMANDWALLIHTGMVSVQLFPPGQGGDSANEPAGKGSNKDTPTPAPAKPAGPAPKNTPAKPAAPAKGQ